jgi:threonine/homoserine efflux transporter RhtA
MKMRAMRSMLSPAWLVVGSVVSVQAGQALGRQMFDAVDPATVVLLRLVFAAVIFMLLWRPRPPGSRRTIALTIGLGTAIAGMNLIYPALAYLPLGVAVSLQLLGPLTVAVVGSRRLRDLGCAVLAGGGVALFYGPGSLSSAMGMLLALLSGASMGAYVVLNKRAGAHTVDGSLLSWAVAWAALLSLPTGLASTAADQLQLDDLLLGAAVALLSAVIPYSLDLAALRRLPTNVVATLESLEPVAAGIAGVTILGEHLRLIQWAAVACITAASVGSAADHGPRAPHDLRGNPKKMWEVR